MSDLSVCLAPTTRSSEVVLIVTGDLDLATAPGLQALLVAVPDDAPQVVVDLGGVEYLGCAGLRPLLEAQQRFGDRLRLRRVRPAVQRLLELAELTTTFAVVGAAR